MEDLPNRKTTETSAKSSPLPSINHQRKPRWAHQLTLLRGGPVHHGASSGRPRRRRHGNRRRRQALPHLPPFDPAQPSTPALLRAQSHPVFLAQRIRLLLFLFFVFFEPEHENGAPVVVVFLEQPIVDVPRDLHGNPIDFDFLVASEFPLYALYLQDLFVVDEETEPGVVIVPAINPYFPRFSSDSCSRGVDFVGEDMLSFQDENLGTFWLLGFGFGVGFFSAVADEKRDFAVDNYGDVEAGMGLRSAGPELGFCKVPKDLGVGVELFGSVLFPENEGGDVELERI